MLLVCVGATIGKCTLVPESLGEFSMARSVALIKPNKELVGRLSAGSEYSGNHFAEIIRLAEIENYYD